MDNNDFSYAYPYRKCASTSEIIKKLQDYEKENGVGAVLGVAVYCNGDRAEEFAFSITNNIHCADTKEIEFSSHRLNELFGQKGLE